MQTPFTEVLAEAFDLCQKYVSTVSSFPMEKLGDPFWNRIIETAELTSKKLKENSVEQIYIRSIFFKTFDFCNDVYLLRKKES